MDQPEYSTSSYGGTDSKTNSNGLLSRNFEFKYTNTMAVQLHKQFTPTFHINTELGQKKFQLTCQHHILKLLQFLAFGRMV